MNLWNVNSEQATIAKMTDRAATPCQNLVICPFCARNKSLPWFCLDCHLSMCKECRDDHGEEFPNHSITLTSQSKCPTHSKTYAVFCRPCDQPVCADCLIDQHSGHRYISIKDAFKEKLFEVAEYRANIEGKILPVYDLVERKAARQQTDYDKDMDLVADRIEKRRNELKAAVDELCDKMQTTVKDKRQKDKSEMETQKKGIETQKKHLCDQMLQCDEMSEKGIYDIQDFLRNMPNLASLHPFFSSPIPCKYLPSEISVDNLKVQTGSLMEIEIVKMFECDHFVGSIHTNSVGEACISFQDNQTLVRLNSSGNETNKQELGFKPECLAMTKSGAILASDRFNHCIWKLESNQKKVKLITTGRSHPKGLCLNHRQEIVICISGLQGNLGIYSSDGSKNLDNIGNDCLNDPHRVAQNMNEDYVILDNRVQRRQVIAINKHGSFRWNFNGAEDSANFNPMDLCCDSLHHVLIADYSNNSVLLLDKSGQFLMYLLTMENGIFKPRGICIDRDKKLWVGQEGEKEKETKGFCVVAKYLKS